MKFERVSPDENYFAKWTSETGKFEIGLHRVMFGVRIRSGFKGEGWVSLDYCAGANDILQLEILAACITQLEKYPETAGHEVYKDFPTWEIKPIDLDPCWENLQKLAYGSLKESAK